MKVRMQILKDDKSIEDYTVPDHSWIQTETLGAQHVPAVAETIDYTHPRGYTLRFTPISPPKIPPELRKLLDSRDTKYGRDGFEWMGSSQERAGGTTLDRAREYCDKIKWARDLPLREEPQIKQFCETELAKTGI